eukprot:5884643-Pleurochrysis_carterae.AAC.1
MKQQQAFLLPAVSKHASHNSSSAPASAVPLPNNHAASRNSFEPHTSSNYFRAEHLENAFCMESSSSESH